LFQWKKQLGFLPLWWYQKRMGTFVWIIMPFKLKNVLPIYQWTMNMAFHEYLKVFMKLFMDDFNVFSDLKMHLVKLWLCFDKHKEFGINLNPKKCVFLVYSRTILGYIIFWENHLIHKWTQQSWICLHQKHLKTYKFQWDGLILSMSHQEFCLHYSPHHETFTQNKGICVDCRMLGSVGGHKT
jgi:hypothetical protein